MERLYVGVFLLFFHIWKLVNIHFSCLGESCNCVLLWSSRSVLWTKELHWTFYQYGGWVDNDWILMFGWTIPLTTTGLSRNNVNIYSIITLSAVFSGTTFWQRNSPYETRGKNRISGWEWQSFTVSSVSVKGHSLFSVWAGGLVKGARQAWGESSCRQLGEHKTEWGQHTSP